MPRFIWGTMKIRPGLVVAITGASSGIGKELAAQLAARGCHVALAARRGVLLEENARAIRDAGARALAVVTDVTKRSDVENFVARTMAEFGRIDVFVNNAGAALASGSILENSEDAFRRTMETNFMSAVYGVWAAAPVMEKTGGGLMVFVSSIVGKRGVPMSSAYCASKFAVQGLTESIRPELARKNIRVTAVCPPGVDTPFFDDRPRRRRFRVHPVSRIVRDMIGAIEKEKRELLPTMDAKLIHWANFFFPSLVDRLAVAVKGDK
jgi:NAD(P)-dependent dehydrogenase (short-subunit alcohol dehydrogenase family)